MLKIERFLKPFFLASKCSFLQIRTLVFCFTYFTVKTKIQSSCRHTQKGFLKLYEKKVTQTVSPTCHPNSLNVCQVSFFFSQKHNFLTQYTSLINKFREKKSIFELLSFFHNSFLPILGILAWQFAQSSYCF